MKIARIAVVLLLGIMLVSGFACCGDGGGLPTPTPTPVLSPTPTPIPTTTFTPTPDGGSTTKKPEDVIPLTIEGFNFRDKEDHLPGDDVIEQWAYSYFLPKANTEFYGKVQDLQVFVYLFADNASARDWYLSLTESQADYGTSTAIQVNGVDAILIYDEYLGEAIANQQLGRFVISSDAISPFEVMTYDEEVIKDAAIEGLRAIRL